MSSSYPRVCRLLICALVSLGALACASVDVVAQTISPPTVVFENKDHVDMDQQGVYLDIDDLSIGNGDLSLDHHIIPGTSGYFGNGFALQSFSGILSEGYDPESGNPVLMVAWGSKLVEFGAPAGTRLPAGQTPIASPSVIFATTSFPAYTAGEQLINNGNYTFTYIQRDGTSILYNASGSANSTTSVTGFATTATYPDGRTVNIKYTSSNLIQSVTSNYGLQLLFSYAGTGNAELPAQITAFNATVDYCDPLATSCTFSQSWPSSSFSWPTNLGYPFVCQPAAGTATFSFTDMAGRVSTLVTDLRGRPSSLTLPGSTSTNITYTDTAHCTTGANATITHINVHSSINIGATTTYAYSPYNGVYQTPSLSSSYQATDPLGAVTKVVDEGINLSTITAPDGTLYTYDGSNGNNVQSVTKPEGGTLTYTYDSRNNITQVTEAPKTGSSLPSRTMTASYDATCTSTAKCNKPNSVVDYNGNETDYTYDPTTGQVLTVTGPAAPSGVRPQTRYTYQQLYASVSNGAGGYVQASSPISLLYQTSTCKTGAAAASGVGCALGSSDEIITTYEYGPASGPNNLWLRGVVVDSAGLALRTCYAYDVFGNKISQTSPLANLSVCP